VAAAEPLEFALLQHAQQLHLHGWRQFAHLVQEQRAAVGQLQRPFLSASAPVNAPFSYPNNSDSMRSIGRAAQLTVTNGFLRAAS
jgi:hypothetical protein